MLKPIASKPVLVMMMLMVT